MSYIEDFKNVIFGYSRDIKRYLSGDKEDYIYCEEKSLEHGIYDKNHKNRKRLCYALTYNVCEVTDKKNIVRELFIEELKDRETNSFQGIGGNLEMFTSLLLEIGDPSDKPLFERAKNANFDCACGYEPRIIEPMPLDEFSLYDCINALSDLGETELMLKFTNEFKNGELDYKALLKLRYIAEWCTKRESDKEFAAERLYELYQKEPSIFDKNTAFNAVSDYIELLIEKGDISKAEELFNSSKEILSGYKRNYYKLGAVIISKGADEPKKIWSDILPFIQTDLKNNMVAPINKDHILTASRIAGDKKTEKQLVKYFHLRK
ncbi:MAG: hypothetical protein K2J79_04860 [Ruminiclostridium sp.]|nr:hypothetical protein [Ruminiclostridium sp.]